VGVWIDSSGAPMPVLLKYSSGLVLAQIDANGGGKICMSPSYSIKIQSLPPNPFDVCQVAPNTLETGDSVSFPGDWGWSVPCLVDPPCLPTSCAAFPCPVSHPLVTLGSDFGCCLGWLGPCQTCCTNVSVRGL
jgi:hypothetical protein